MKNQCRWGTAAKRGGGLGQFANLREGGFSKKEGVIFLRGVYTPMHTIGIIQTQMEVGI